MWTPTTRQQHSRPVTRYQTDLTDAEWRVIAPHLPKPCATGRPREWPMREIVNGIFYVVRAGCPWRLLPNDLPPWGTIYRWFAVWRDDGRFERINHAFRSRTGRAPIWRGKFVVVVFPPLKMDQSTDQFFAFSNAPTTKHSEHYAANFRFT